MVINFSCISTRLVAEACENTVCKHWTLKHWEDIFVNCHELPFTCSNAGVFQSLCFSLCALFQGTEGRNYNDVSKISDPFTPKFCIQQSQMLEMKVQIVIRCEINCTTAILNSVCNSWYVNIIEQAGLWDQQHLPFPNVAASSDFSALVSLYQKKNNQTNSHALCTRQKSGDISS